MIDQVDEEVQQCETVCAIKTADHRNSELEPNGSENKFKKRSDGLFGLFLLVLPFVLLSVMAWAGTRDGATIIVKQVESRRKMQENAEAYAEACELCSETNFTTEVDQLFAGFTPMFEYLRQLIVPVADEFVDEAGPANKAATLTEIASNLDILLAKVEREDIEEFYFYYLVRQFYGSLGSQFYLEQYQEMGELIEQCHQLGSFLNLTCPPLPEELDQEIAKQNLWNHADNVFSSICTSGAPMPLWSEPDGSGYLLVPNKQSQTLHPVSGSGINMSAPIESLKDYFLFIFWGNKVDPTSPEWKNKVEVNPLYSWLMSSLDPAAKGTGMLTYGYPALFVVHR